MSEIVCSQCNNPIEPPNRLTTTPNTLISVVRNIDYKIQNLSKN